MAKGKNPFERSSADKEPKRGSKLAEGSPAEERLDRMQAARKAKPPAKRK